MGHRRSIVDGRFVPVSIERADDVRRPDLQELGGDPRDPAYPPRGHGPRQRVRCRDDAGRRLGHGPAGQPDRDLGRVHRPLLLWRRHEEAQSYHSPNYGRADLRVRVKVLVDPSNTEAQRHSAREAFTATSRVHLRHRRARSARTRRSGARLDRPPWRSASTGCTSGPTVALRRPSTPAGSVIRSGRSPGGPRRHGCEPDRPRRPRRRRRPRGSHQCLLTRDVVRSIDLRSTSSL